MHSEYRRLVSSVTIAVFLFSQVLPAAAATIQQPSRQLQRIQPGIIQPNVSSNCTQNAGVSTLSPNTVAQGQTNVQLTMMGAALNQPDVSLDFGPGITVAGTITSTGGEFPQYKAVINVAPSAPAGPHPVTIIHCGGRRKPTNVVLNVLAASAPSDFPLISAPPCSERAVLTSGLSPAAATQGQSNVQLTFSGFLLDAPDVTLDFGAGIVPLGRPVKQPGMLDISAYSMSVNVLSTAPAGQHPVLIRYCNGKTKQTKASLNVLAASQPAVMLPKVPAAQPNILTIVPNQWEPGKTYTLTLSGQNLVPGMEVRFGDGVRNKGLLNVLNQGAAQIDVEIDPGAKGQRTAELLAALNQPWLKTNATAFIKAPLKPVKPAADILPLCTPVHVSFTKGTLNLSEPRWGDYGPSEFKEHKGAPLLNDVIVFTWTEKNPGLAHYYEFNLLTREGKLLKTVKIEGKEAVLFGKKVKLPPPTYFHPDAAFIKEILAMLPPVQDATGVPVSGDKSGKLQAGKAQAVKTADIATKTPIAKGGGSQQSGDGFPPETSLLWEVIGYRTYESDCGFTSTPPAERIEKKVGTGKTVRKTGPAFVDQAAIQKPVVISNEKSMTIEVEKSERWPLSRPANPDGLTSCSTTGFVKGSGNSLQVMPVGEKCVYEFNEKTQKWEKKMENRQGKVVCMEDPSNYPGDPFRIEGSFTLDKSPYQIQAEMKKQTAPSDGTALNIEQPTGKYTNIVVDWGDGAVETNVAMTFTQTAKGKGSYGTNVSTTFTLSPLEHAYSAIGSYYVRVYLLSDDDMQAVKNDIGMLSQSVDKNSNSPYYRLASLDPGASLGGRTGRLKMPGQAAQDPGLAAIASRAYVIFCKRLDIRPVEDYAATGPLHLDSIEITGFPGHDSGDEGCPLVPKGGSSSPKSPAQAAKTLAQKAAQAAPKLTRTGETGMVRQQPFSKTAGAVKAAAAMKQALKKAAHGEVSACDSSLIAEATLGYYGQGEVKISWQRDGISVFQKDDQVGPSRQREGLSRDPNSWGPPEISYDDSIPNSDNLLSNDAGKSLGDHTVKVDAMVIQKPSSPQFGRTLEVSLGSESLRSGVAGALSRPGPGGQTFKAGFLSPAKVNRSGASPVAYANPGMLMKGGAASRAVLAKPFFVSSDPATYTVKETNPTQPCTFLFSDGQGGEFTISGLQGNTVKNGTSYTGCGTLLLPIVNSREGEPQTFPIPIQFKNWSVTDGSHVDAGTKLSVEPDKTFSAPGLNGTIDKVEGTAGAKVNATISLALADTLRLVGGTEKPQQWAGKTAPLSATGDWYLENQTLPETFIGWSAFTIQSDTVTIDLSRKKSAGPVSPACGSGGGNAWVGVHLGSAKLNPYLFDLVPAGGYPSPVVNDWAVVDNLVCGRALIAKPFDAKVVEGTVHFDSLDVESKQGSFTAVYKNMDVYVPWIQAHLKGDAKLQYEGGGKKGLSLPLTGSSSLKDYGTITMQASKLAFKQEGGVGWAVLSDTHFDFIAEGKPFSSFDATDLLFGLDGKAYFPKGEKTRNIGLGTPSALGPTALDLLSVDLDTSAGGSDRLKFGFNAKINLSKKMPSADMQVLYSIVREGSNYSGTGPVSGPFNVNVAFPPGQPAVEANVSPNYTGPASSSAGLSGYFASLTGLPGDDIYSDVSLLAPVRDGEQYALNLPGSWDTAGLLGSGDGDRFNGSLDLSMFGGPPVKAEFRLGYKGGDDYWLMRATIPLGDSGVTLTPYLSLFAIRGGLGYNFPINAFQSVDSLSAVAPDMSGTYMFMAGMRVGSPAKFPYMLDGDFTVKLGVGARMDYRAWLLTNEHSGKGTFYGYFQYAAGNFDGMLAGKLSLMGDLVYAEIPENAATMHFGGGTWHIYAGKKEGPRINLHLLIMDTTGYFMIGNEGLKVGGGMEYNLNAGIGRIHGSIETGLEVTPEPHITGFAEGSFSAEICAFDVCIGPSISAGVSVGAMPLTMNCHACFEIPIPFWNPEVCGDFSL
ncbi:MAG: hypothetical protein OHK006_13620 [Thermodesulfovibrionales bacterium]